MNNKAEYLQFRTSLFQELDAARASFDLYRHLVKQLDESTDIYLEALPFFELTVHSLSRTALAILTNVFEMRPGENKGSNKLNNNQGCEPKKSKAKTIHKFLSGLDSNHKNIFQEDKLKPDYECIKKLVKEHQKLIEEHADTIQTLMHRRDKYFAHHDSKYFNNPNLLDEKATIFNSQFLALIDLGNRILNAYPGGPLTMYAPIKKGYKEALDKLFFKVKEYNKELAPTVPVEKITIPKYEWDFELLERLKVKQSDVNSSPKE